MKKIVLLFSILFVGCSTVPKSMPVEEKIQDKPVVYQEIPFKKGMEKDDMDKYCSEEDIKDLLNVPLKALAKMKLMYHQGQYINQIDLEMFYVQAQFIYGKISPIEYEKEVLRISQERKESFEVLVVPEEDRDISIYLKLKNETVYLCRNKLDQRLESNKINQCDLDLMSLIFNDFYQVWVEVGKGLASEFELTKKIASIQKINYEGLKKDPPEFYDFLVELNNLYNDPIHSELKTQHEIVKKNFDELINFKNTCGKEK